MLPFGVTIPATVPQRLEIPEGLMNYPVHWVPEVLPPGVKSPVCEADHSLPSVVEVKKLCAFMAWIEGTSHYNGYTPRECHANSNSLSKC
jgi:hypothetical protein